MDFEIRDITKLLVKEIQMIRINTIDFMNLNISPNDQDFSKKGFRFYVLGFPIFNSCNLSCDYCYVKRYHQNESIKEIERNWNVVLERFLRIPAEIFDNEIQLEIIPFGESFLYQKLIKNLLEVVSSRVKIKSILISTNGTIEPDFELFCFLEKLNRKDETEIMLQFSFDGIPSINIFHRGISFEKFYKNLKLCLNYPFSIILRGTWTPEWVGKEWDVAYFSYNYFKYSNLKFSINLCDELSNLLSEKETVPSFYKLGLYFYILGLPLEFSFNPSKICFTLHKGRMYFAVDRLLNCSAFTLNNKDPNYNYEEVRNTVELARWDQNGWKFNDFYLIFQRIYSNVTFKEICKNCFLFESCLAKYCLFLRFQNQPCMNLHKFFVYFFIKIFHKYGIFPIKTREDTLFDIFVDSNIKIINNKYLSKKGEVLPIVNVSRGMSDFVFDKNEGILYRGKCILRKENLFRKIILKKKYP